MMVSQNFYDVIQQLMGLKNQLVEQLDNHKQQVHQSIDASLDQVQQLGSSFDLQTEHFVQYFNSFNDIGLVEIHQKKFNSSAISQSIVDYKNKLLKVVGNYQNCEFDQIVDRNIGPIENYGLKFNSSLLAGFVKGFVEVRNKIATVPEIQIAHGLQQYQNQDNSQEPVSQQRDQNEISISNDIDSNIEMKIVKSNGKECEDQPTKKVKKIRKSGATNRSGTKNQDIRCYLQQKKRAEEQNQIQIYDLLEDKDRYGYIVGQGPKIGQSVDQFQPFLQANSVSTMPNFSLDCSRFTRLDSRQYNENSYQQVDQFLKDKIVFIGLEGMLLVFDNVKKRFENKMKMQIVNSYQPVFKNFGQSCYLKQNYVFYSGGGISNECYLLELLELKRARIVVKLEMKKKRIWHSVVYDGEWIYMIGGFDGVKRLRECEKVRLDSLLDRQQIESRQINSMNQERSNFGCCLVRNRIIYVGGGRNAVGYSDSIECYDIGKDKWQVKELKLPVKLMDLSMLDSRNRVDQVLVLGGSSYNGQCSQMIYKMDFEINKIFLYGKLQFHRNNQNKVYKKNGEIIIIGGNRNCSYEVFQISSKKSEYIEGEYDYDQIIRNDLSSFSGFSTL